MLFLAAWAVLASGPAWGAGVRDVPLVNWSYLPGSRDWLYDAVEKVVDSGLAGPAILNIKPMTRREMARIVLRAVDRIRKDPDNNHNDRKDMEGLLMALIEEFRPELRALGFHHDVTEGPEPGFWSFRILDQAQMNVLAAGEDGQLQNQEGKSFRSGGNVWLALNSWAEAGDYGALYANPEFYGSGEDARFRLVEGYARLGIANVDVTAGREAIWWGPGYHGSMWFSSNAQPPWMFQVRSREAFELPGFLRPLGQFKLIFHLMQLDKDQVFPRPYVTSARLSWAPFSFVELGFGRSVTFGGQGRQKPVRGEDFPRIFFTATDEAPNTSRVKSDSRGALDATFRFHDVDRFFPLTKDIELYGSLQIDDTRGSPAFIPNQPGYQVGVYMPNFLGNARADARVEYAYSSPISFTNALYSSGFEYKGFPLAHFIGTGGRDLYLRTSYWVNERIQVANEVSYSRIRSTEYLLAPQIEETLFMAGPEVSYSYSKDLRFRLGIQMWHAQNLDLVPGRDRTFPVFQIGVRYDFGGRN